MGKKKGKKGKGQDSEQSPDLPQAGGSGQQPTQPSREDPRSEDVKEKKPGKGRQSEEKQPPEPIAAQPSGKEPRADVREKHPGKDRHSQEKQQPEPVSARPSREQSREEAVKGKRAGKGRQPHERQPPEPTAAQQQPQVAGTQRQTTPVPTPEQWRSPSGAPIDPNIPARFPIQQPGGPRGQPGQPSQPVRYQQPGGPWGQPGQPSQPVRYQQPGGPWGQPGQPSQPVRYQQPGGPWGQPGQPSQPVRYQQPGGPWSQPGQPSQPVQYQQRQDPRSPPELVPQQGPRVPPGLHTQQPREPRGAPGQPTAPQAQQPRGPLTLPSQPPQAISPPEQPKTSAPAMAEQPKESPQKGKQKGPRQAPSQPKASTSQPPPTGELSKMQISKTGELGKGDAQLLPMKYVRAKPGVKGRVIHIETNHLSLNVGPLKTVVHYDVNLIPDTPKSLLRAVLEAFRLKHYKNNHPAFDGRKNLYSKDFLPFGNNIEDDIIIEESISQQKKKFRVEIKFANKVDMTPLRDLLRSEATPREALQVVDIVLRSAPAAKCIPVGNSFFVKPATIIDLGEGMQMYSGFYQSAIRGWKPFLNVDVAHKSFPKQMRMTEVLFEILGDYYRPFGEQDLNRSLNDREQVNLDAFIKTLKISYEIPGHPSTKRIFRVNGIDDPPATKTFSLESGERITIEKYFRTMKNYNLRYPKLPSLWVGALNAQKKILLPLELCTVIEDQVTRKKMTEGQTSKMIRYAATSTTVRKEKIMTSLRQAGHNNCSTVKEFGMSIGNEFEKLQARVLDPPSLQYNAPGPIFPSKGVWRGDRFIKGITIDKWTIVCVDRRPPRADDMGKLADMIMKNAQSSGMTVTTQPEKPFPHIGTQSLVDIRKYFQNQKEKNFDVIFVIVPDKGPQYSYVKTAAELNVGCLTQCIKSRTLSRINPQTVTNILLKVNSKLNGTNHCLKKRPPIMDRPCMIMGADVTHPSPDAKNIPSVAAVTASHDPKAFQYNICWRLQPPKVEIIEDLEEIVIEQLRYFEQKNRVKPERIVFFRDGVSEGQFDQVRTAEIRAIRKACKRVQAMDYEPSITFLVVQKRHHTRLFPTNPRDSEDRNFNVPAGTCVDTIVTHPFMQDFYLVSHASIQGMARPTKYCTLWDDNSMSNDDIEELTYHLCHLFARCNRSVSYPAPTYYAHLAAARAKVYIENVQLNMEDLPREYIRFKIQEIIRKGKPMFFV